jgi:acyl transferase domain-containing protein
MDTGPIRMAHSPSGRCHTFDIKADGYMKAEAVNAVILKRLEDAIRDGDPIRAVIRGSATNSDGRTAGIASPSSAAQAEAVRSAYRNAGITDMSLTGYLECHGTGTQVCVPSQLWPSANMLKLPGWRSYRSDRSFISFLCISLRGKSPHHRICT